MNKKSRICAVCRDQYKYCPHCREDRDKPTWHFIFCSSNCKGIYDVTSKFENGELTANMAKEMLSNLDLSKLNNFGDSYKSSIKKINGTEKKVKEEEKNVMPTSQVNTTKEIKQTSLSKEETEIKKAKNLPKVQNSDF